MKRIHWIYFLIFIACVTASCRAIPSRITSSAFKPEITSVDAKTTSTTQQQQMTSIPTFTPIKTTISSGTALSTSTITPPLYATLATDQVSEVIDAFLLNGGDCASPCFLGIIPGNTRIGEALEIYRHLGLPIVTNVYENNDNYGTHYETANGLKINANLTRKNEIVNSIRLSITPEITITGINRAWLVFSPQTLITRYGSPSSVKFVLDWGPRSYFEMDLYFEVVDLIVEYSGYDLIPRQKGSSSICPLSAQFDLVRIWMGEDPINPPLEAISLEIATSMAIEEFSSLMLGNPEQACFTVNGDVFPQ